MVSTIYIPSFSEIFSQKPVYYFGSTQKEVILETLQS